MASVKLPISIHSERSRGLTLTLPLEYRPRYRNTDPLLRSSSDQSPLSIDPVIRPGFQSHFDGAVNCSYLDQPEIPLSMHAGALGTHQTATRPPPFPILDGPHYVPHWQRQAIPDYLQTVPPPVMGRRRRGYAHSRGWNNLHIGRVHLPPMNIKSVLQGTDDSARNLLVTGHPRSALDFFIPHFSRFSNNAKSFEIVRQIELCTTWRGLSAIAAEELFVWIDLYRSILEHRRVCGLHSVNLSSIAVSLKKLFERKNFRGLSWFLSAPDTYHKVERFLAMCTRAPMLQLYELERPCVGQEYTVAPRLEGKLDGSIEEPIRELTFSASVNWLSFDATCNVFSGIVPPAPLSPITFKATMIEHLDNRIRREHVIRTELDLDTRLQSDADSLPSELKVNSETDGEILPETPPKTPNVKKKVSFADICSSESSRSTPEQLMPFLNQLSALTLDTSSQSCRWAPSVHAQAPPGNFDSSDIEFGSLRLILADDTTGQDAEEDNYSETSLSAGKAVSSSRKLGRFPHVRSSMEAYPDLPHLISKDSKSLCSDVSGTPGYCPSSGSIHDNSTSELVGEGDLPRNSRPNKKPLRLGSTKPSDSFITSEVSGRSFNTSNQRHRARRNVCRNGAVRSDSLQLVSHPSTSGYRIRHLAEGMGAMATLDTKPAWGTCEDEHCSSMTPASQARSSLEDESLTDAENTSVDLDRWGWRGWEKEVGLVKAASDSVKIGPGAKPTYSEHDTLLGPSVDGPESETDGLLDENAALYIHPMSPTLSPMSTSRKAAVTTHDSPSNLITQNKAGGLGKKANSVADLTTLYDTVRAQFYYDYQTRQKKRKSMSLSIKGEYVSGSFTDGVTAANTITGRKNTTRTPSRLERNIKAVRRARSQIHNGIFRRKYDTSMGHKDPGLKRMAAAVGRSSE